jgi:transposase
MEAGTTGESFLAFINGALTKMALRPYFMRTFLWDNLRAHNNPQVQLAIAAAGHRIVPRPKYMPRDAPIEYMFNQLEQSMKHRYRSIHNLVDFNRELHESIANLKGFRETFIHCGYR